MRAKTIVTVEFVEDLWNQGKIQIGEQEFGIKFRLVDLEKMSPGKRFEFYMARPDDPRYWYEQLEVKAGSVALNLSDEEKNVFARIVRRVEVESTAYLMPTSKILHAEEDCLTLEMYVDLSPQDLEILLSPKFGCQF